MDADADITGIAALLADPARVAMLDALFDGRALSAGELARCARSQVAFRGVAPDRR